ncbi:MAG TPA: DUF5924 family protein [Polyangiaceae bacterium]|nr:DUF5924 family protein [Polyangiaceae bacterium]
MEAPTEPELPEPELSIEPQAAQTKRPSWQWLQHLRPLLPWGSLALGIASALSMDRGPRRAAQVATAAVAVWFALTLALALGRLEESWTARGQRAGRWLGWVRFFSMMLTQSSIQLCLFFSVPFYFRAADVGPGHVDGAHAVFLAGLCALCALCSWDPWTARLLRRPLVGPVLPAIASFVGLDVVLPGFGISTQHSLWLASAVATWAGALLVIVAAPRGRSAAGRAAAGFACVALPLAIWLGAARVVPPAPLRLVRAEFGTAALGKWIADPVDHLDRAPERLIFATAIAAPLGLHDRLFHVWRKDGREISRLELDVVGGREQGYRTRSWLGRFDEHAAGRYDCSIVTETGQELGGRALRIGPNP